MKKYRYNSDNSEPYDVRVVKGRDDITIITPTLDKYLLVEYFANNIDKINIEDLEQIINNK